MKTVIHRADKRGHANHGWLNAKHSFSFASWYNPDLIHFGALRVLNDDEVSQGMGFGKHPHENMEIITLVQEGALEHQDSLGHTSVMKANDVQVMSAGKGVFHSEVNHSKEEAVKLFQIWVFPDRDNVEPRYEQKSFSVEGRKNQWQEIIKPSGQIEGEAIFIYQDAWFSLCDLDAGKEINYSNHKANNVLYLFVIEGDVELNEEKLKRRDAIGVSEYDTIQIKASSNARLLAMDVPQINLQ